jgi:hypothetical protein
MKCAENRLALIWLILIRSIQLYINKNTADGYLTDRRSGSQLTHPWFLML